MVQPITPRSPAGYDTQTLLGYGRTPAPDFSAIGGGMFLGPGHYGDSVQQLQGLLSLAGFILTATGFFGPGTERSVREFQRQQGLPSTGTVDGRTLGTLLGVQGPRTDATKMLGRDRSRRPTAPTGPTVPATKLIDADAVARSKRPPPPTRFAGTKQPPPRTRLAKTKQPSAPTLLAKTTRSTPQTIKEDATHRRNLLGSWRGLKNNGRDWAGNCNLFANRMMWTAGPKVKAAAETKRLAARRTALEKARTKALANAPHRPLSRNRRRDLLVRVRGNNPGKSEKQIRALYRQALTTEQDKQPRQLTRSQRQTLATTQRRIKRRYAAKNMQNYLPALQKNGKKAYRGFSMQKLAQRIKTGGEPKLRPGMTIHVKAFPHEKDAYGKKGPRDPNNPTDQNHHWFTYVGKNEQGVPMFADSRGKQRTAENCDKWLRGWMKGSLRKGKTRFGDYTAMKNRLIREGHYRKNGSGRYTLAPGVQPTIEGIYSPFD